MITKGWWFLMYIADENSCIYIDAKSHENGDNRHIEYEVSTGRENWTTKPLIKVRMIYNRDRAGEVKTHRTGYAPSFGSQKEIDEVIKALQKLKEILPE